MKLKIRREIIDVIDDNDGDKCLGNTCYQKTYDVYIKKKLLGEAEKKMAELAEIHQAMEQKETISDRATKGTNMMREISWPARSLIGRG